MEAWAGVDAAIRAASSAAMQHSTFDWEQSRTEDEKNTPPDAPLRASVVFGDHMAVNEPHMARGATSEARGVVDDVAVHERTTWAIPGTWLLLMGRLIRGLPAGALAAVIKGGAVGMEEWMADEAESRLPEILRQRPKVNTCVSINVLSV